MVKNAHVQRLKLKFFSFLQFQYISGKILIGTRRKSTQPCRRASYLPAKEIFDYRLIKLGTIIIIYRTLNF